MKRFYPFVEEDLEKDVYSATLLIIGDVLDPQAITAALSIEPNQSWRRGEPKEFAPDTFYEWGGWKGFMPTEMENLELDEQIIWWCERLEGKESIMKSMEEKGFRLEMNCFATSGFQLDPDIMGRLSELCLILTVNIH